MSAKEIVDLLEEQIAYYRRGAHGYDKATTPPGDFLAPEGRQLVAALDAFRPRGSVLEIAAGTGTWTVHLVRYASELTALDASPEMLSLNRANVNDPRVRYVEADIFSWEPDAAYDVVVFANWLSHVPPSRFEDFWELVARSLGPRGRVLFFDEMTDAWRGEETLFLEGETPIVRRTLKDGGTYRVIKVFWKPQDLEARLRALGWRVTVHPTGAFYWAEGTWDE